MLHHSCPRPFRAQIAATPLASLLYLFCLSSVLVTPPSSASDARTVLMADAEAILYHSGLEQVQGRPERIATNPVIANDKPWEVAIAYCSIQQNPSTGLYQCWYQSYAGSRAQDPTRRVVLCYATSKDGLVWEKPSLGLYDFNGDPDTNIVLVGNGGRSVNYGASVLIDSRDADPGRRYKLAYWDFAPTEASERPGLCVAFSPDGVHWTKHPQAPLLQGAYGESTQPPFQADAAQEPQTRPSISDVMDLMWDPVGAHFSLYTKTWVDAPDGRRFWKRAIVRSTSTDFVHWTAPEMILHPNRPDDGQFHGLSVVHAHGLYLGLLQRLDFGGFDQGGSGRMPAELIWSQDGQHWQRPFSDDWFLPLHPDSTAFDAGCLWTSATVMHHEKASYLYYGAYPSWHADFNAQGTGIGVRVLPRDRWVGLHPQGEIGQVTFKPWHIEAGSHLTLNADASEGELRVEWLDASGYRIQGLTQTDGPPLKGDHLEHRPKWKTRTPSGSASNTPSGMAQLRVHLQGATLYAVTLHPPKAE